jgi:hypothetical protein
MNGDFRHDRAIAVGPVLHISGKGKIAYWIFMRYFFLELLDYLMLFDAHDPIINSVNVLMKCLNEVKFFCVSIFFRNILDIMTAKFDICHTWYLSILRYHKFCC